MAEAVGYGTGTVRAVQAGRCGVRHAERWARGHELSEDRWRAAGEAGRERCREAIRRRSGGQNRPTPDEGTGEQ